MKTIPLRRVARIVNGGTPTSEAANWGGDVPWATPVDLGSHHGGCIAETGRTLTRLGAVSGSALVPAGSVLVSTRAPIGYVARTRVAMAFNQGCRALVPRHGVDGRFLAFAMLASRPQMDARGQGSTFRELSTDSLASIEVPLPSLDEQRRIADYLDTETSRLDALVRMAEGQAGLAREALEARLEADVAKIGREVPLKRLLTGPGQYGLNISAEDYRDDGVRLLRTTDIGARGRLSSTAEPVMVERPLEPKFHLVPGDVLVSRAGSVGAALVVDETMIDMTFAGYLVRLRPGPGAYPAFLADVLQLPSVQSRIRRDAVESTILNFNAERYGALTVPAPRSVRTQKALSDAWAVMRNRTDAVNAAVERMVSLITERRQALITAAVTGQLDVTTAHGGAA